MEVQYAGALLSVFGLGNNYDSPHYPRRYDYVLGEVWAMQVEHISVSLLTSFCGVAEEVQAQIAEEERTLIAGVPMAWMVSEYHQASKTR